MITSSILYFTKTSDVHAHANARLGIALVDIDVAQPGSLVSMHFNDVESIDNVVAALQQARACLVAVKQAATS